MAATEGGNNTDEEGDKEKKCLYAGCKARPASAVAEQKSGNFSYNFVLVK